MIHPRFAAPVLLVLVAAMSGCGGSKDKTTGPVTPLELNGNLTASGGQYAHQFSAAGNYPYHCTIHSSMTGIVVVSASFAAADSLQTVVAAYPSFSPASISLPVGGVVTWTNSDPMLHTVTSN